MLGLVLVTVIVTLALDRPLDRALSRRRQGGINLAIKLQPPSAAHWLGTDEVGNDILTRVIIGARISLLVGIGITAAAAMIGVPLGILAGLAGGRLREVIMRFTDLFLSVPGLVLAIALVAALGPGIMQCDDRADPGLVAGLCAAGGSEGAVDPRGSRTSRPRASPAHPARASCAGTCCPTASRR